MKQSTSKYSIRSLAAFSLCAAMLTGCGTDAISTEPTDGTTTTAVTETTAETTAADTTTTEATTTAAEETTAAAETTAGEPIEMEVIDYATEYPWLEQLTAKIRGNALNVDLNEDTNVPKWDVEDVNGDGIAELFLSDGDIHAAAIEASVFNGNYGSSIYTGTYGEMGVLPSKKILYAYSGGMGAFSFEFYNCTATKFELADSFSDNIANKETETVECTVNDKEVTESAYLKAIKKYFPNYPEETMPSDAVMVGRRGEYTDREAVMLNNSNLLTMPRSDAKVIATVPKDTTVHCVGFIKDADGNNYWLIESTTESAAFCGFVTAGDVSDPLDGADNPT